MTIDREQLRELILQELPALFERDPELQRLILRLSQQYFADRRETESRFDQILEELRRDREEQSRRWAEQMRLWEEQNRRWEEQDRRWDEQVRLWDEQNRKWEEQNRRWEEQDRRWEENQREIRELIQGMKVLDRRFDSTIGALGARWGLSSEQSFRSALRGILTDFFPLEVIHVNEYDDSGEVFGRPEQIELDLIIKNGVLLICEIKSSMSKADMYLFERKARWYQQRHGRTAQQLIVISPMVDPAARKVAERLGIVVYSFPEDAGEAITEL
ncbi:PD-(D/E)XK nuclease family protein [Chloroflexus sp.]|uniref:PD-(D/E)XK nuclease family protein n=1 Tax=Chloroflexus sp. TaxID=1904827 RepID=UPI003D1042B8